MFSPYQITEREEQISDDTSHRVQKQIVHIETSHFRDQLEHFHCQAQPETVKQCYKKAAPFAAHGKKKAKGDKNQDVSKQICENRKRPQDFPVFNKAFDLIEQHQIVAVFPARSGPPVPVGEQKKVDDKRYIRHKQDFPQSPPFFSIFRFQKIPLSYNRYKCGSQIYSQNRISASFQTILLKCNIFPVSQEASSLH